MTVFDDADLPFCSGSDDHATGIYIACRQSNVVQCMKAIRILKDKKVLPDGTIVERVVWQLPEPDVERRHGYKYRLYCGRAGNCLVRYDNERGKGDHRHYGEREENYRFVSLERLLDDFEADVQRLLEVPHGE